MTRDFHGDFHYLKRRGYNPVNVILMMLKERGSSISALARGAGVSPSLFLRVLHGERSDTRDLRGLVSSALGFDPWA